MAKKESPAERVQHAFPRLTEVAKTLNEKSDQLGDTISALEVKLKKLNLGVTSWVEFKSERDEEWGSYCEEIGYARTNGKWGISIRTVAHDYQEPEPTVREWLFNDAARVLRLRAVSKIPELLEQLIEDGKELAKNIDEKSAEVAILTEAIENSEGDGW